MVEYKFVIKKPDGSYSEWMTASEIKEAILNSLSVDGTLITSTSTILDLCSLNGFPQEYAIEIRERLASHDISMEINAVEPSCEAATVQNHPATISFSQALGIAPPGGRTFKKGR